MSSQSNETGLVPCLTFSLASQNSW